MPAAPSTVSPSPATARPLRAKAFRQTLAATGVNADTPATVLCDGDAGLWRLQREALPGATVVLDWWHAAVRFEHALQAGRGLGVGTADTHFAGKAVRMHPAPVNKGRLGSADQPLRVRRLQAALGFVRAHGLDHEVQTYCRLRCGPVVYHAIPDKVRVDGRSWPGQGMLAFELALVHEGRLDLPSSPEPNTTASPQAVAADMSVAIRRLEYLALAALDDPEEEAL